MGTPTKRRTSGQRKRRASHFSVKKTQFVTNDRNELVPQRYKKSSAQLKASKTKKVSAPKKTAKKS